MGEYNYQVVHQPGKSHGNADVLSRKPCQQCQRTDVGNEITSIQEKMNPEVKDPDNVEKTVPDALDDREKKTPDTSLNKKTKKCVHWKADGDLADIKYIENDPDERVNVSRMKIHLRRARKPPEEQT